MSEKETFVRATSPIIPAFLRLALDPGATRWLMRDPNLFAAFHAALAPRVRWPASLATALPGKARTGAVKLDDRAFVAWRRRNEHPFNGQVSPLYLLAFWEGLQCHGVVASQPALWHDALRSLVAEFPVERSDEGPGLKSSSLGALKVPSMRLPDASALTLFSLNLGLFLPFVDLSPIECEVLELAFLLTEDESVRLFFELLGLDPRQQAHAFPTMFGVGHDAWDEISGPAGTLSLSRMVSFHPQARRVLPMSSFWHGWFTTMATNVAEMHAKLVVPLKPRQNSGALARVRDEDEDVIRRLFCAPCWMMSEAERAGINVLLYGSSSIDKVGWVASRLSSWSKSAYSISPDVPDSDMASACFFAQRYVARMDANGVLVIPRADGVLTRTRRGQRSLLFMTIELDEDVHDSEGERVLVEQSPTPGIWLTSGVDRLSEDNIGRFLYVSEMRGASRADRRKGVAEALKDLDLPESFHAELAQHTQLGLQQVRNASRLAALLLEDMDAGPDGKGLAVARQVLVRQAVEQGQKALGRSSREVLRPSVTQYSLDFLNTSGAFSIDQVIQSLRARPSATLCFWGLPGTGKTQLAEHIAVAIDRPIITRRASDLLGMYVGENEKHLRAMFAEAADEDAVLLLDEADTFLRDRRYARTGWEVSMVNELLQGMERFPGVFICATNLFDSLDAAALRRFTFKVEFRALTEQQAWQMFVNETGLDATRLSPAEIEAWKLDLVLLRDLTPGDFATVQRTRQLLGVDLSPSQWFQALKNEVEAKMRAASATRLALTGVQAV